MKLSDLDHPPPGPTARKSEYVAWILALRGSITNHDGMVRILRDAGFEKIGSGMDKIAFLRGRDRFVVKVRKYPKQNENGELVGCYNALARHCRQERYWGVTVSDPRTLIPMAYSDGLIQIQPKVSPCVNERQGQYGCYSKHPDGHAGNHTHVKGRTLLFDYD